MAEIHASKYGDGPGNFHVNAYGDTLNVELTYPNITVDGCRHIHVNQESVRASDGIRLSYDYDRDGWSIEQQVMIDLGGCMDTPNPDEWVEVAFVRSWGLVREPNGEAA
ncbi:hypothetical protein ASF60_13565 [Methylobacterium sp. Leaf113]|uniref:hypothetical protein n=1 Tax=Methylobacterium sp. Leaf113 TaxID=1736259 RepID=UPI0006F3D31C|nr:hypothetical protein [Methylobacterium sp. Leaf113]KQP94127.1 hypothetical protein ASF60_13565 [Methylobacterium sp. Leaf113]